ncbi:hypothetical protein V8C40DRAFT_240723 [Trichoderma camerunense]
MRHPARRLSLFFQVVSFVLFRTANLLQRLQSAQRMPKQHSTACAIIVSTAKDQATNFSRRLRQQPEFIVAGLR